MFSKLRSIIKEESFHPTWFLGPLVNPLFIIRRRLDEEIKSMANCIEGSKLLDIGCGSKPYKNHFNVKHYIGLDTYNSGHDHKDSKVDIYYDGINLPFDDEEIDIVFSSEVFEHVADLDNLLNEIHRVLKKDGTLFLSCPFVWDEHEQPYDFVRFTSFGIKKLATDKNFFVSKYSKSSNYLETIFQMITAYIYQHIFPKNKLIKFFLTPLVISPLNLMGIFLSKVLPKNYNFYLNNILIAKKNERNK